MSDWVEFLLTIALTLLLSLTAVAVIRRPLLAALIFICGTDVSARFWTSYASVMSVVGPLFLVAAFSAAGADPVVVIRSTIATASLGLMGAFIIMAVAVTNFMRVVQPTPRDAATTATDPL